MKPKIRSFCRGRCEPFFTMKRQDPPRGVMKGRGMTEWSLFDRERLDELRSEIGEDDLAEVVSLFLEEADEVIARLSATMSPAKLTAELHFLKGAALNLGLQQLCSLCQEAERLAAQINGQGAINVAGIISTYHASRKAFLGALAKGNAA